MNNNMSDIDKKIQSINWDEVPDKDQKEFVNAVLTFQAANIAYTKVESASSARKSSFIATLVVVALLTFFQFAPETVLIWGLITQMIYFGYSQILQFGTEKIQEDSQKTVNNIVNKFKKN
jgi:hypothetical protein